MEFVCSNLFIRLLWCVVVGRIWNIHEALLTWFFTRYIVKEEPLRHAYQPENCVAAEKLSLLAADIGFVNYFVLPLKAVIVCSRAIFVF